MFPNFILKTFLTFCGLGIYWGAFVLKYFLLFCRLRICKGTFNECGKIFSSFCCWQIIKGTLLGMWAGDLLRERERVRVLLCLGWKRLRAEFPFSSLWKYIIMYLYFDFIAGAELSFLATLELLRHSFSVRLSNVTSIDFNLLCNHYYQCH